MMVYLDQKARVMALIGAQSASVGMMFDDIDSVSEALQAVENSPDAKFAIVFRTDG